MIKSSIILALMFLLGLQSLQAQKRRTRRKRDFKEIKTSPINYVKPDTAHVLFTEQQLEQASISTQAVGFDAKDSLSGIQLKRALTLVSEDTSAIDGSYPNLVEISEELKIDCVWVTSQKYYSIWDSRSVDPYKIDGIKFNDTTHLVLFDTVKGHEWAFPIHKTKITSTFGMRHYRWHYGTDLRLAIGDTVVAAFDGIVRIAQYDRGGYGYYVVLRHYNGLETLYGHLSSYQVKVGDVVNSGDIIGFGGSTGRSTGPHLHFEILYQGNALNPLDLYNFKTATLRYDTLLITPKTFSYLKEARKVIYHKIRSGDTLSEISRKYGVSINTICRFNGISRNTILKIGRRLRVR